MFLVQGFFELFETMLSYFSNTLSYVRIGAFAVSHAAIMEVVLMLSGATDGSPNIIGLVIGNIVVCGLEGLVVGIQVLRLEYYEMFSRFYKGTGREFKPFKNHKKSIEKYSVIYFKEENKAMTVTVKILLIATLILSIVIPFGYYLIGEKNKKRYKRAIGTNIFFYFGAFIAAGIMLFSGTPVQAADAAAGAASNAAGFGYLAAALSTGLSCVGGGIAVASAASAALGGYQRGLQRAW